MEFVHFSLIQQLFSFNKYNKYTRQRHQQCSRQRRTGKYPSIMDWIVGMWDLTYTWFYVTSSAHPMLGVDCSRVPRGKLTSNITVKWKRLFLEEVGFYFRTILYSCEKLFRPWFLPQRFSTWPVRQCHYLQLPDSLSSSFRVCCLVFLLAQLSAPLLTFPSTRTKISETQTSKPLLYRSDC